MTRWRQRIAGRRRGLAMDFMIECLWLMMVNDGFLLTDFRISIIAII
jgi:hypothetical protein